jgi:ring-1,2-phenylacetyl-CoA epoxidase subunit PaaB
LDTQWPRFQVFLQDRPGTPHQDVGSVHAPDAELALFNARDVFVRRPECTSLWVVPADAITSKTAQELDGWLNQSKEGQQEGKREPYLVFTKSKSAGTQTYQGQVEASSPEQALRLALEQHPGIFSPFVWWVFPARLVLESDPAEAGSFFDPAKDKKFRLSTDFHTHSKMREIHKKVGKP